MNYLILPIYNEEQSIPQLLSDIRALMAPGPYKIIAVNDGSSDQSLALLRQMAANDMVVESYAVNMNVGVVFSTGLRRALELSNDDRDIVVILESDQTSRIEVAMRLIQEIELGSDIAIASRYKEGGGYRNFPLTRVIYSRGVNALLRLIFPIPGVHDYTIFLRGYRVGTLRQMTAYFGQAGLIQSKGFIANAELLIKGALLSPKIVEIPFMYDYGRKKGKSKIKIISTMWEYALFIAHMKEVAKKFRGTNS